MDKEQLNKILELHKKWLNGEKDGIRADLSEANLSEADLSKADLSEANLSEANLSEANLSGADLSEAYLYRADLSGANLTGANLSEADLSGAYLSGADLSGADLSEADLSGANLYKANLTGANLSEANLSEADLSGAYLSEANLYKADLSRANLYKADLSGADLSKADLSEAKNLIKTMGVECGNIYWKRFNKNLINNGYQFKVGLNKLKKGEIFANDERVICSYPGFYFASRSWCAANYSDRPIEGKIRIPEDAKINEPWASDGKASANKIEILQLFDVRTGEDITNKWRNI